ncbi:MAG: phosphoglycerate dehydrogenase [Chloroflexi bacterium]|nr:phosphoglycerate dehydrogenase [Chloroflexota bacterium]
MGGSGSVRPRVVVADRIAEAGLEALREQTQLEYMAGQPRGQLLAALGKADALLVRSETRVTRELLDAAPRLRVIGRAGAGVDTIDLEAATARGIVVVNAPGGNAVAAAEHTLALLFALARRVAAADAAIKRGEWSRSSFLGIELTGKTLGLIGLGRVGMEVGRRAAGLEMRVLVYDPYVASDQIRRSGFEAAELDQVLTESDVVSLHVPLTEATRGILDRRRLALLREGALLINCARGGLVDEDALLSALDTGHLAGAGLDVFSHEPPSPDEPLALHPRVVATPHLGASTVEAQVSVAAQVADEVLAVLHGQPAQFAVNAPTVRAEEAPLVQPYVELTRMLGKLATQLANGHLRTMEISYRGEIAEHNVSAVTAAGVQGMLESISETHVNLVNARLLAQQRGLEVVETRSATPAHYLSLVQLTVHTDRGATSVAGAVSDGTATVVGIDGYDLHLSPTPGYMLVTQHTDQPGIIGLVGTVLGQADINISSMQVGRRTRRGQALMLLAVDEPVPADVLARIRTAANIASIKVISL